MATISVYPDKALKKKLEGKCKEENRSMNNLIITILQRFFEKEENGEKE